MKDNTYVYIFYGKKQVWYRADLTINFAHPYQQNRIRKSIGVMQYKHNYDYVLITEITKSLVLLTIKSESSVS